MEVKHLFEHGLLECNLAAMAPDLAIDLKFSDVTRERLTLPLHGA